MTLRTQTYSCLILLIGACAQGGGRWENASLPQETWSQDDADCRAQASQKNRHEQRSRDKIWSSGYDQAASVTRAWDWQSAQRRKREFVEDCMIAKGYRWTYVQEAPEGAEEAPPAQ